MDIKALIAQVESRLYGDKVGELGDGVINRDNKKEIYLFNMMAPDEVKEKAQSDESMRNEIFGLQLSGQTPPTASTVNRVQRRVEGRNGTVINIEINVNVNVVVEAQKGNYDGLIDELIDALTKKGGKFENFIAALIQTYSTHPELDLSKIEELIGGLKQAIEDNSTKIENNGVDIRALKEEIANLTSKIGTLEGSITNLDASIREALEFNYEFAEELGINLGNLKEFINNKIDTLDKKQTARLSQIYQAVMRLSNNFTKFTGVAKQYYEDIMNKFGDINPSDPNVTAKLDLLYNMLLALQKTADDNGANIAILLQKGDDIINKIDNLHFDIPGYDDTEIKNMLSEVLTNQTTQYALSSKTDATADRIEAKLKDFDAMVEDLKAYINNAKVEVIEAMKNAASNVVNNVNEHADSLTQLIIEAMKQGNTTILNEIAKIKPSEVNLDWIRERFDQLEGKVDENGRKLDKALENQIFIKSALGDVLTKISTLQGKVNNIGDVVDKIYEIVSQLRNCDCEHLDVDALLAEIKIIIEQANKNEGIIDLLEPVDNIDAIIRRAPRRDDFGDASSINTTTETEKEIVGYVTTGGIVSQTPVRGQVNIVRFADGTTKTVRF